MAFLRNTELFLIGWDSYSSGFRCLEVREREELIIARKWEKEEEEVEEEEEEEEQQVQDRQYLAGQ